MHSISILLIKLCVSIVGKIYFVPMGSSQPGNCAESETPANVKNLFCARVSLLPAMAFDEDPCAKVKF